MTAIVCFLPLLISVWIQASGASQDPSTVSGSAETSLPMRDPWGRVRTQTRAMMTSHKAYLTHTYTSRNELSTTTDAEGNTSSTVYDGAGRKTRVTSSNGLQTDFAYDDRGFLCRVCGAKHRQPSLPGWVSLLGLMA